MARFQKGVSGNPGRRPKKQIADLGIEARKFAGLGPEHLGAGLSGQTQSGDAT
jgi:hypothetical protein